MFLPGTQLGSPIKLVFVLFISEKKKKISEIGKCCPSDGLSEFRLPKVDSPDPSIGHCLGNTDAHLLFLKRVLLFWLVG